MISNSLGGLPDGIPPFINPKYIRVVGTNLSTGDTDLYTVPSGRKLFLLASGRVYNPSAGSITFYINTKISGTYYRISGNSTRGTLTSGGITFSPIIIQSGESVSINTATTNGLNVVLGGIEMDNSTLFYVARNLSLSNGDNILYTCPAGKSMFPFHTSSTFTGYSGTFAIMNTTGGAVTMTPYNVTNGGSIGTTSQIDVGTSISDSTVSNVNGLSPLSAGDFLVINTSSGTAGQHVWMNYFEI